MLLPETGMAKRSDNAEWRGGVTAAGQSAGDEGCLIGLGLWIATKTVEAIPRAVKAMGRSAKRIGRWFANRPTQDT